MRFLLLAVGAIILSVSCTPRWVVEQQRPALPEEKRTETAAAKVRAASEDEKSQAVTRRMDEELFERFKTEIQKFWNAPYVWGGTSPQGTDCSGMIMSIYRKAAGLKIPRTSRLMWEKGEPVAVDELQMGDLVFFNETGRGSRPTHVGLFIEKGVFIHATVSRGVTLDELSNRYYSRRYIGARRFLK